MQTDEWILAEIALFLQKYLSLVFFQNWEILEMLSFNSIQTKQRNQIKFEHMFLFDYRYFVCSQMLKIKLQVESILKAILCSWEIKISNLVQSNIIFQCEYCCCRRKSNRKYMEFSLKWDFCSVKTYSYRPFFLCTKSRTFSFIVLDF